MSKVCIFIGSRANYSSIKSVMVAIKEHPSLQIQIIVGASALLDRFGCVVDLIEEDGFKIDYRFHSIVEGESPTAMATSTGLGLIKCADAFENLKPDFVLIVGDRFEIMSVAIAASYMNIPVAHTMGGEVSGTIDESIRHALTKLSHIHFPANDDAMERIIKMGESKNFVHNTGCPRIDLVKDELEQHNSKTLVDSLFNRHQGVGEIFDLSLPFILVSQHPVTTEYGKNRFSMDATLEALHELQMNTIIIWPNADAGSDEIARAIRIYREKNRPKWLHTFKNLPTREYIHLLNITSCLVGNSSSGIREGSFIGTPVVNIGSRQNRRLKGKNVIDVINDAELILSAIKRQIEYGKYKREHLYGDGFAGQKICQILSQSKVEIQKTITY